MTTRSLRKVSKVYEENHQRIKALVGRFTRKFGGEEEEHMGEANLLFLKAWETWDEEKGPFEKRLSAVVWCGLLDHWKKDFLRGRTLRKTSLSNGMDPPNKERFQSSKFKDLLSEEAAFVVDAALDPPPDVKLIHSERGQSEQGRVVRSCLREFLSDIGWPLQKIIDVFSEIKNALR